MGEQRERLAKAVQVLRRDDALVGSEYSAHSRSQFAQRNRFTRVRGSHNS